ncbi:hypothetical protein [Aestuariibaculum lutulentum]|uniref:Transmembrane protein n=1 Tax=Aestuariibaculum lutulentum TaxID=2920935 RepID=A0ABS9RMG1_9FLAO|nr:hypothetical protein [Aestuariibaculum lutulentum]MCH4554128.1 hypothetical protein [Aestuariibaculum lutulentum]
MKNISERHKIVFISLIIYLVSLTQKTYCVDNDCGDYWNGYYLLIYGWVGLIVGGAGYCWIANPLLILSWLLPKDKIKTSLIFSGISAFFAIIFLFFSEIMKDEAGHYGQITGYKLGYILWLISTLITFIGFIYLIKKPVANKW